MKKSFLTGICLLLLPFAASAAEQSGPVFNLILEGQLPEATLLRVSIKDDAKGYAEYTLPLVQGKLLTGIRSPVGKARSFSLQAEDARGERLYQGEVLLEDDAGFDTPAVLELKSALDGKPAEVTLASRRVTVEFAEVRRGESVLTRMTAQVFDADGRRLPVGEKDLAWEIEEPWIGDLMQPCKGGNGATLCAEFDRRKFGDGPLQVGACYRGRICRFEFTPAPTPVWEKVSVAIGEHVCALKKDGTAWCWGQGEHGQLGDVAPKLCTSPTTPQKAWGCSGLPMQVQCAGGPCNFIDISAGKEHTCAIDTGHNAWCWGSNGHGEGGRGVRDRTPDGRPIPFGTPVPQLVTGGLQFSVIRAGGDATCGLTTSHAVYCWGSNFQGLVPDSEFEVHSRPMPVAVPADTVALDLRSRHACVRTLQGQLLCWGTDTDLQLSAGTGLFLPSKTCSNCPNTPLLMQSNVSALAGQTVALFSTGSRGTCASLASGNTECWGSPLPVFPAGVDVEGLSRGFSQYCAMSRGSVSCAGLGFLGDGTGPASGFIGVGPVAVRAPPLHFRQIDAGNSNTCGIGYDEQVHCWGENVFGQLGRGAPGGQAVLAGPILMPAILTLP